MKKLVKILIIITTFLFNISSVFAIDINIKEVKVYDKNDTITVSNISLDNTKITPEITFNKINDYVTYKVVFKGKDTIKYKIKNISDNNKSEYIRTTYSSKEDLTSPVFITLEYHKEASKSISLNDINVVVTLEDESGNEEEVIIYDSNPVDKSNQEKTTSPQTGTLSYILTPIILIIISIFIIKYYTKNKEMLTVLILVLLSIPLSVIASENIKISLTINASNIQIKVNEVESTAYTVYLYPNGGTGIKDGQAFTYTETAQFSEFPKVTKEGCILDGWNVGSVDGKKYYENVDETDNGKKLYARWTCQSSADTSDYKNQTPKSYSLSSLSCKIDNRSALWINPTISSALLEALEETCQYLKNNNIYGTTNIQSAGTWNDQVTIKYPHYYAMGIDLFNNWSYSYNGKTYHPYQNYGDPSEYKNFICNVCNGDYKCDKNLNYQIYERIFKPRGFCWGGNWKSQYFDPMHFQYDAYDQHYNCASAPQITINCN